MANQLVIKRLGLVPYSDTIEQMQNFTAARDKHTPDEIWLLEHPAVFTQGQAGKQEHILAAGNIPVIQSDRGGQVTYHGPGQLVCYLLMDIKRKNLGIRDLVTGIERSIIDLLSGFEIEASARREAPGVYVQNSKVAALGLRIRKGCSYHGLSLNVAMDLEPFSRINPCGYAGLEVTDLCQLGVHEDFSSIADKLVKQLLEIFGYDSPR
ncbi:MAG: lipoyl(octanoyl) transferase LipB [Pseudomonadales bacterium]